jgi:hypothetical protein
MAPGEMENATLYWTMLAASVSAVWIAITFLRDRIAQALALNSALMTRLMEYDKLNLEHPEIQQYLSRHVAREEAYFHSEQVLEDLLFYKAKTLVYNQLNLFDEILSIAARSSRGWGFLKPTALPEKEDWEEYIKLKLRHPLYRSILKHEQDVFGAALREFWLSHQSEIESKLADRYSW